MGSQHHLQIAKKNNLHSGERIDGDRHSQKVAICKGRNDKPRLMGVASHLLSRWYI